MKNSFLFVLVILVVYSGASEGQETACEKNLGIKLSDPDAEVGAVGVDTWERRQKVEDRFFLLSKEKTGYDAYQLSQHIQKSNALMEPISLENLTLCVAEKDEESVDRCMLTSSESALIVLEYKNVVWKEIEKRAKTNVARKRAREVVKNIEEVLPCLREMIGFHADMIHNR